MKTQKKLFVLAAFILAASMVFAQTSMTSHSTQGLFGTDVDDFMNVNEWQNVQPKNIFGFLGYGAEGDEDINLGIAHQFKALYLGTYFEGKIPGWSKTTAANTTTTETDPAIANKTTTGKLLFGFGNIGVLADTSFTPKAGNQETWNSDTKTKTTANKFNLKINLTAGINLNANNKIFKISPRIGLDSEADKTQTITDGKLTSLNDASYHDLMIGTGFYHDFSKKDAVTQTIIAELDTSWRIYPKKTGATAASTTSTYGRMHNEITLAPAWQIAYEPEGKFAVKAVAGLETTLTFDRNYDYTLNSDTGKAYNGTRKYTNTLNFSPILMAGFTYMPISKLRFNLGMSFKPSTFEWKSTKTQTRNTATGEVTKTVTANDLKFATSDGTFTSSSGFTWFITENVTLDANWNIIQNLLNNTFKTQLTEGDGTSILDTVNKLVVHNIGFAVSVKF
ncbi:hypothetical protein E4O03_09620 [Treponema sp. OMZ 792]|uniref:TDE2508 family outer membrane beta-barrel protein n=1 Tax=unclassified Treponema TaxID=2638727 RepID=UPI0020A53EA9|nr:MULTISPECIES: hypothetical protein [unclassified Treponema]UTC74468.1 hypothetical protein E4O03_09620 [Treponema sp. OMZ 792]UTC80865.1 hypothetical protein E4O07_09525 [Treponema sp. OMZ 798]